MMTRWRILVTPQAAIPRSGLLVRGFTGCLDRMACETWFYVRLCFDGISQYTLLRLWLLKLALASYAMRESGWPSAECILPQIAQHL
jgi:hypothetical protein